jgi:hypothetical protein
MPLAILTVLMVICILITQIIGLPIHWVDQLSLPNWLWLAAMLGLAAWLMND